LSEASHEGGLAWPPTKEDLERLYLVEKLSAGKIAVVYGLKYKNAKVAESTVLYELKKNGIKRRDRADHVRKVTEEMVDEWVGRYRSGESLKQIAEEVFSPVTIFLHLRKRGLQLRDKVEAQIQAVTKYERRPFEGSEIDRAYLVGFTKGDCQTIRHGRAIRVRTSTTHPDMEILFNDLFGRFGLVHRYPRKSKLTGYEWSLEVDLDGTFEFLLKTVDDALAEYARSAATFLSFLAGFADAEGSVYFHTKGKGGSFEISLANTDLPLLTRIQAFLDTLGHFSRIRILNQGLIRLGYEKSGKIGRLIVWRHIDVIRLLQLLPLRHGEKRAKADLALALMQTSDKKVRREILNQWNGLLSSIDRGRKDFVLEAERRYLAKQKLRDSHT
jgi:LAGLIDADG-like domain